MRTRSFVDADDKYYLVRFKVVNYTTSDNRDSYTVDIKQTAN